MRISGDKITGLMGFSILFVTLFLFAGPSHAVTLVWNESPDDDVVGYRIYWGGASRQYSWMVELESAVYCDPASNECQYDLDLPQGRWYIAVTAFNEDGLESGFSNEVQVVVGGDDLGGGSIARSVRIGGGDDVLVRGCRYTILWDGLNGESVRILLLKEDKSRIISRRTANDGKYRWRVPAEIPAGEGYRISIKNGYGQTESDYFRIARPRVFFPNDRSRLYRGSAVTIKWDPQNFCGERVKILLYNHNAKVATIAEDTGNDGKYLWRISLAIPVGSYYRIKIKSKDSHSCRVFSDGYFMIW